MFASALTEVWQVKIGEDSKKVGEAKEAWKGFVASVGNGKGIQGTSLNQDDKLWIGVLGWESSEVSLQPNDMMDDWLTRGSRLERKYLILRP